LEARGHRSKTSTNKVSALPQWWLRGSCLECSRSVVEVSSFRSWTCLHAALVRLITENIPTVKSVWRPVDTAPRPPPTRSLLCHRGGSSDPAWSPVDQWWRSQRFGLELSTCSFGTFDKLAIIATVEPVWRPVVTGPRPPPTRCLLIHRGGCLEPAWSPVHQWWRSQGFEVGPVYMQLWYA